MVQVYVIGPRCPKMGFLRFSATQLDRKAAPPPPCLLKDAGGTIMNSRDLGCQARDLRKMTRASELFLWPGSCPSSTTNHFKRDDSKPHKSRQLY